jgi:hypothetical protein
MKRSQLFVWILSALPIWLNSQTFTIQGIQWDTIYIGVDNKLLLEQIDCSNIEYSIKPSLGHKLDSCTLTLMPYSANVIYELTIQERNKQPITFNLFSQRLTHEVRCLGNNPLTSNAQRITPKLATEIRGVMSIVNCPWNKCRILGYDFRIERNGEILFAEEIKGWELTSNAKERVKSINSGELIVFDDIKWKCPGDDANGYTDIIIRIE